MRTTWNDLLCPGDAATFFELDPVPPFEPATREYSSVNAWWLAELSRIVYRRDRPETTAPLEPPRSDFMRRAGLDEIGFARSDVTGAAAVIVRGLSPSPFAVLAFRGTEQEIRNILCDAQTWPVPAFGSTARVHGGFKRALNSVWTPLVAVLARLDCPVFYTGHSLGAALAMLAAVRHVPQAVYVYGAPRVGDAQFANRLRAVPVFRIVHGNDVVTTVPPEVLGYRHAGEELRIGKREFVSPAFNPKTMWSRFTTPISPLADHAPVQYVNCCASALSKHSR